MKKAFTLIELLVVVLIIGILAAIALPQYQRVVYKARYATVKSAVKSIAEAQEVHYLSNGVYADSFDDLDVQVPGGYSSGTDSSKVYTWGVLNTSSSGQTLALYNFPSFSIQYQVTPPHSSAKSSEGVAYAGRHICVALNTTDPTSAQAKFCQNETGKTEADVTSASAHYLMYFFN